MSTQFQAHPAGIIEAVQAKAQLSSLVIPRLTYTQMKAKDLKPAIQTKHYTGPKRVNPPALKSTVDVGVAFKLAAEKSLKVAGKKEADYLNQLNSEGPYGWNGLNNNTTREEGKLYLCSC